MSDLPCESKWCEPRPCKLCGAAIVFALTPLGKRIPLDVHVDPDRGNVAVDLQTGKARVFGPEDAAAARAAGAMLYLAHFATCAEYKRREAKV